MSKLASGWPDLTRTEEAIKRFDEGIGTGEDVGKAFALDTIDRNNPETARMVRPGGSKA